MPGKEFRLLSTASFPDNLCEKAREKDLHIDVESFIQIVPFYHPDIINEIKVLAAEQRTVIFTSKEAVRILLCLIEGVPDWQIYCLNGATSREVLTRWQPEAIRDMAPNGKELCEKISKATLSGEVLFFSGLQRLPVIPEGLTANAIPFREIVLYRTRQTPHKMKKDYRGIFFYSPSGVESFFSVNQLSGQPIFTIGETTSQAVRSYVGNDYPVFSASRPEKQLMLDLAIRYFEQKSR